MNEEHQHLWKDCSNTTNEAQKKTIDRYIRRSFRRGVTKAQIAAMLNDTPDHKVTNSALTPHSSNGARKLTSRTRVQLRRSDSHSLQGLQKVSHADDSISVLTSPRNVSSRKKRDLLNNQPTHIKKISIDAKKNTITHQKSVDFHEISGDSDVAEDSEKILASWLTTIPTTKSLSSDSQKTRDRSLHARGSESECVTIDKEKLAGFDSSDDNKTLLPINTSDHKQIYQVRDRQESSSHRQRCIISKCKSTSPKTQPSCYVRETDFEGQLLEPK